MTHADNGDAVEANASAASQQAEKQAQQTAVLRFMALHELLGDALANVDLCVADRPDLATPLGLIRGLGADVGVTGLAGERLDALEELYRIPAAQGDALAAADLLLASADSDPESLLEAMAEGALLAIHVDMGGGAKAMAASAARLNAIAGKIAPRSDVEGLAARNLYRDRWIVMRKTSGDHGGAALEIMARRAGQAGAARAASALPGAGRLFSLAEVTRAHPRGRRQAAYKLWAMRRRRALSRQADRLESDPGAITHFGVHAPANAGDRVLFEAVRAAVEPSPNARWALRDVRAPVTPRVIDAVNRSRGMVIGGGGLFLVDITSGSPSGWQWPCPTELLRRIDVPIAVFAVGYNRFRGQGEFPAAFVESLHALAERADFIGIRNHGSIRALSSYLPEDLADKLTFQPCPTTVMSHLDMPGTDYAPPARPRRRLVINTAFDRFALRMAGRERETLGSLARVARRAADEGWEVTLVGHLFDDEAVAPFLKKEGVPFSVLHFTGVPTEEILRFYRSVDLVIGMRGHAQMVPFGLGTPILSLIAHDKMGWFLDDIGHPEWGVDFRDPDFGDRLDSAFGTLSGDLDKARVQIDAARSRLWDITRANVGAVRSAMGLAPLAA